MDKNKKLQDIFANDPLGLLDIKPSASPARNADERLVASFQEINDFYEMNHREPEQGGGIQEHQLHSRLRAIRKDQTKMEMLKDHDPFGLLNYEQKQINSLDDILSDDSLGLLDDDSEGLFDLKHVKPQNERAGTDFVAKRKPCKDFLKYEPIFKTIQKDLSSGNRKLIPFKEDNLREGDFYVYNGILFLIEKINITQTEKYFADGTRIRKDGRTRCIFENGTESNMLYRSVAKVLYANGKVVTKNKEAVNKEFLKKFSNITDEDQEAGFIYILKSKNDKKEIKEIQHLYKIGYSKSTIEERIKNAAQEPTYLMSDVHIVMTYKCYNMNPQKLEQLLHNFFGSSCLNIDIFDNAGNRHSPREWFIAPLDVIDQAIHLIISGAIVSFKYDPDKNEIVPRLSDSV